ncbi:MucBP domain-containing protein, partial [Lactobacillus sp. AN1001]
MLSKKNKSLFSSKFSNKKQRYTLKKTQLGVASVLIGTLFTLNNVMNVSANTTDVVDKDVTDKSIDSASGAIQKREVVLKSTTTTTSEDKTTKDVQNASTSEDETAKDVQNASTSEDETAKDVQNASTSEDETAKDVQNASTLEDETAKDVQNASTSEDETAKDVQNASTSEDETAKDVQNASTSEDETTKLEKNILGNSNSGSSNSDAADILNYSENKIQNLTLDDFKKLNLSDDLIARLPLEKLIALNSNQNFYEYNKSRIGNQVERAVDDGITDRSAYVGKQVDPTDAKVTITNSALASPPTITAKVLTFDVSFKGGLHKGDYFFVESQDLPVELPPRFNITVNGKDLDVITVERIEYESDYYRGQDTDDSSRFELSAAKGFITKRYKYKLTFTDKVEGLKDIHASFTRTFSNQTLAVTHDMPVHEIVKINDNVFLNQEYTLPAYNNSSSASSYGKNSRNDGKTEYLRMNATVYDMRELGTPEERAFSKDVKSEGIMTFNGEVGGLPNGFKVTFSSKDNNPNPYIWDSVNMVGQKLPVYYIPYDENGKPQANSNDGTVYVTPDNMYMIIESISSDRKKMTVRFIGDYSRPGWIVNGTLNPTKEPEGKSSKFSVKFIREYNPTTTTTNANPNNSSGYTSVQLYDANNNEIQRLQPSTGGYYRYTQSSKFSALPIEISNVHQLQKGTIIVNYVDTNGNFLKTKDSTVVENGVDEGTKYDATVGNYKLQTIKITENNKLKEYKLVSPGNYPIGIVGEKQNLLESNNNNVISVSDVEGADPVGEVKQGTRYITYVYEAVKGSVNVNYKDINGNIIKFVKNDQYIGDSGQSVAKEEPVGNEYNALASNYRPSSITDVMGKNYIIVNEDKYPIGETDAWGHLKGSAPVTGTVSEEKQTVTYVYKLEAKKGSVDVTYVTEDGKVLEPTSPVAENEEVGTDYTTVQKDFDGYHFVGMDKKSDPAVGLVSEGTKHVIYVYAKNPEAKKGSVDVTYVTEDGKVLEPTSFVAENQDLGTSYATTQKSFDGYHFVRMGDFSATTTGTVEEGIKHVVYVYAKNPEIKKGSVDVTYVTEDGKVLEPTSFVAENQDLGTSYATTQKDFDGYHFVRMGDFSATTTGTVEEGIKHVVYVYAKNPEIKKGSVDVTYVTEDGKVLEPTSPVAENEEVGTDYTTVQKDFDGYHFVGMDKKSDPAVGLVSEGTKHVIYVYAKNPEAKKGSVDVTYVTEDGKVLEPTSFVAENQDLGTSYATTQKSFDGYHFVRMGDFSATTTGTVEEGIKHVVYVYAKNPEIKKGSVDVTYVTEDGKVLEPTSPVAENEEVGTDYTTVQKDFDGYHFVGMDKKSDPAVGLISEGTKHVIYVYAKNPEAKKGSVDVTYVTEDGKVLEPTSPVAENEEVGTDYTTVQKDFDGYHFVGMDKKSDPAVGLVSEGTKHVIYVYAKNPEAKKGSVDVTYVTEDGKVLEPTSFVAENQDLGTSYATTQKSFDGYHFVRMGDFSATTTGTVEEGIKHVVYVYAKNPEIKKGSVNVTYVEENGNMIAEDVEDTPTSDVDTDYDTTDHKPHIIEKDGKRYIFTKVKDGDNEAGKVT